MRRVVVSLALIAALALAGCGSAPPQVTSAQLERARTAWAGNWHAVWEIEWVGAPVTGPVVAEMWHGADGRLRIETLEAPVAALNGLTWVNTGDQAWLYDVRLNQAQSGPRDQVRIPLADDMLAAMDWLLAEASDARIGRAAHDVLESGGAWRLEITTVSGDAATLWLHEQGDFPAGFAMQSGRWGEARCVTRWLERPERLDSRLFDPQPPPGARRVELIGKMYETLLPRLRSPACCPREVVRGWDTRDSPDPLIPATDSRGR